ncbi:DUF997 family protein [Borreliella turdi]|uniref:DUF997 family protein n=1 Tax=Borreliella turdi TaxID=57863 RepID=UPI00264735EB|nr:DUF997 family protein [Borreliella turdi]WKC78336.1 DUF997 family protein [Borreliella turdi]WKC79256.1 DUF997 family protein [Borreliella turdi]
MRNRILYVVLLYVCIFFLWCCFAYFIDRSATIFNIPLWFFWSGILFPVIIFFWFVFLF